MKNLRLKEIMKKTECLSLNIRKKTNVPAITTVIFYLVERIAIAERQEKEIEIINIGKEEVIPTHVEMT